MKHIKSQVLISSMRGEEYKANEQMAEGGQKIKNINPITSLYQMIAKVYVPLLRADQKIKRKSLED